MVRYATQNEAITIVYTAHRHTSGLSDVTVTIIDLSDGSEELTATTMTEAGSTGVYTYAHTYTSTGDFQVQCNSTSIPRLGDETYVVMAGYVAPTPPITNAYLSIADFRSITGININEAGNTAVQTAIAYFIPIINRHTGKTTAVPWTTSDDEYEMVQMANAYGVAHQLMVQGWNLPPVDRTEANAVSSQWLTEYRRFIYDIAGRDPYPGLGNIGETGEGSGGSFDARIQTVTPDKASYELSTTR